MLFASKKIATSRIGHGFSLIELLIAMAVVAILLAVALPSFLNSQRKSRRIDAFNALTTAQQLEERWRSNNASYGAASDLGLAGTSVSGYYAIAIVNGSNTGTGYTATATAVAGSSQAADAGCQVLAVMVNGGNVSYGSTSGGTIDWTDSQHCWVK